MMLRARTWTDSLSIFLRKWSKRRRGPRQAPQSREDEAHSTSGSRLQAGPPYIDLQMKPPPPGSQTPAPDLLRACPPPHRPQCSTTRLPRFLKPLRLRRIARLPQYGGRDSFAASVRSGCARPRCILGIVVPTAASRFRTGLKKTTIPRRQRSWAWLLGPFGQRDDVIAKTPLHSLCYGLSTPLLLLGLWLPLAPAELRVAAASGQGLTPALGLRLRTTLRCVRDSFAYHFCLCLGWGEISQTRWVEVIYSNGSTKLFLPLNS